MKEKIEKILQSDTLSIEAKEKIKKLSEGEIDNETIVQIEDIIQNEIEGVFKEANIVLEDSEINPKLKELDADLNEIESNLKKDLDFVEKELENLDKVVEEVEEGYDQQKIDDLKKEIS